MTISFTIASFSGMYTVDTVIRIVVSFSLLLNGWFRMACHRGGKQVVH